MIQSSECPPVNHHLMIFYGTRGLAIIIRAKNRDNMGSIVLAQLPTASQ